MIALSPGLQTGKQMRVSKTLDRRRSSDKGQQFSQKKPDSIVEIRKQLNKIIFSAEDRA
jgi:hypothetical protein